MGQGVESGSKANLRHRDIGTGQEGSGKLQTQLLQVTLKSHPGLLMKALAEVVHGQVGLVGNFL